MSELTPAHADEPAPRGRVLPEYLAAARDALRATPVSREALRGAVVRFAGLAREQGASAAEVTRALETALGPVLAGFPTSVASDLRVHVAWWAAHGYHRAD